MQQIATATMLRAGLSPTGGGTAPPARRLLARPHRDEILIRRPLAELGPGGGDVTKKNPKRGLYGIEGLRCTADSAINHENQITRDGMRTDKTRHYFVLDGGGRTSCAWDDGTYSWLDLLK